MIRQTCQRCGYIFDLDVPSAVRILDEVSLSLYLGEWSRQYVLCEACAARFNERLASFMNGQQVNREALDELVAQRPYFSSTGHGAWCNKCEHWKSECTCLGPADDECSDLTETIKIVWTPVRGCAFSLPWYVLMKLESGSIRVGYCQDGKWYVVHRRGTDGQPIMPQAAVVAWAHLPDRDDE